MKTHWLILIFAIALCAGLAFTACGDDDDDDDDTGDDDDNGDDDDDSSEDVWTDSSTGLMWQKSSDFGYDGDDAKIYCVHLELGGYDNWRLPTISELRSLIRGCDKTQTGGACGVKDDCVDASCENNACNGCSAGSGPADGCFWSTELDGICEWHWSSSQVADGHRDTWGVWFEEGGINSYSVGNDANVRCVRSEDDSSNDDFDCNGDVCTDSISGLMWQNDSEVGQTDYNLDNALNYCQDLNLGGHNDWRLPSISELRSLVRGCNDTERDGSCGVQDDCPYVSCREYPCDGCTIDGGPAEGCYWPGQLGGPCTWYKSSTEVLGENGTESIWGLLFREGGVFMGGLNDSHSIRCVRGDENGSNSDVWTDSSTGLMWQKTADGDNYNERANAVNYCKDLSLDDHNDWRLPSISELRSLIRGCDGTETNGSCGVTDDCLDFSCFNDDCNSCSFEEGPADGCYWATELIGECKSYLIGRRQKSRIPMIIHGSFYSLGDHSRKYPPATPEFAVSVSHSVTMIS